MPKKKEFLLECREKERGAVTCIISEAPHLAHHIAVWLDAHPLGTITIVLCKEEGN